MHKLEVTKPSAVQVALRYESEHSPQSRFLHRLHCLLLVGRGQSCYEVAEVFGDDPRSVERWVHKFQLQGVEGLRDKPHTGRNASLDDVQMRELAVVLTHVPRNLGYAADVWNSQLLRAEIFCRFGVNMSARHSLRLFRTLQPA